MKKSDLKTGMWVENVEGEKYIVLLDTKRGSIISNVNSYDYLDEYKEDLTSQYDDCSVLNIIKVYDGDYNFKPDNILWERNGYKSSGNLTVNVTVKLDEESVQTIKDTIDDLKNQLNNLNVTLNISE